MNQKDSKKITKNILETLESYGAVEGETYGRMRTFSIVTIYGSLTVHLSPPEKGDRNGAYWIFQRFEHEALQKAKLEIGKEELCHYSGKWNFYEIGRKDLEVTPYFYYWKLRFKHVMGMPS